MEMLSANSRGKLSRRGMRIVLTSLEEHQTAIHVSKCSVLFMRTLDHQNESTIPWFYLESHTGTMPNPEKEWLRS